MAAIVSHDSWSFACLAFFWKRVVAVGTCDSCPLVLWGKPAGLLLPAPGRDAPQLLLVRAEGGQALLLSQEERPDRAWSAEGPRLQCSIWTLSLALVTSESLCLYFSASASCSLLPPSDSQREWFSVTTSCLLDRALKPGPLVQRLMSHHRCSPGPNRMTEMAGGWGFWSP